MSAASRTTRRADRPTERASKTAPKSAPKRRSRADLTVVDPVAARRRARQRLLFSVSAAVVALSLFAVAVLYGRIVEGQRQLDALRSEIGEAEADRALLEREIAEASTPEAIVDRAFELGMVRAVEPRYLVAVRPVTGAGG